MPEVFLGLGSNLGDRLANLEDAVEALRAFGSLSRSSWYETKPVDMPGEPDFLNGVVRLDTRECPFGLLARLHELELKAGRDPEHRDGPRALDIDILLYGDEVIDQPRLRIPHPRMQDRAFVLVPLAELAPRARHPLLGMTAAEMLSYVSVEGVEPAGTP